MDGDKCSTISDLKEYCKVGCSFWATIKCKFDSREVSAFSLPPDKHICLDSVISRSKVEVQSTVDCVKYVAELIDEEGKQYSAIMLAMSHDLGMPTTNGANT